MALSRTRRRTLVVALAVLAATATLSIAVTSGQSRGAQFIQPFSESSPFRTPIGSDVQVDPNSAAMVGAVTADGNLHAAFVEFGIPIFTADAQTPRYTVPCRATGWGPCPFDGRQIPIPDDARPHTGSDGAMVVIDESNHTSYEFWQAVKSNAGWSTEFGAVNDTMGSGWGGAATGSGASRLGGVIRIGDVQQGSIPHALALQTNNVCAGAPRPPAIKSDGRSASADCLPEGARLQLDPTLNLDSLDLRPGERMVAEAMQRYGGYIIDVGGAPLSVSFEMDPQSGPDFIGSAYQEVGFRWDYDGMTAVPWQRLRVVQ